MKLCCAIHNGGYVFFPVMFSLVAGVAKLVYAPDSKSGEVKLMSVRVRPPAPNTCAFPRKTASTSDFRSKPAPKIRQLFPFDQPSRSFLAIPTKQRPHWTLLICRKKHILVYCLCATPDRCP